MSLSGFNPKDGSEAYGRVRFRGIHIEEEGSPSKSLEFLRWTRFPLLGGTWYVPTYLHVRSSSEHVLRAAGA